MRLLADENVPTPVVLGLRDAGHDVVWVREIARGMPDIDVLAMATEDQRLLITADKDFGELVFREGLATASGVVLIRARTAGPGALVGLVLEALQTREEWGGSFSVIEDDRVRTIELR